MYTKLLIVLMLRSNIVLPQMATAGFIHTPSENSPDTAICFFCLKELEGWEPEDDPEWDKSQSPAVVERQFVLFCPFLLGTIVCYSRRQKRGCFLFFLSHQNKLHYESLVKKNIIIIIMVSWIKYFVWYFTEEGGSLAELCRKDFLFIMTVKLLVCWWGQKGLPFISFHLPVTHCRVVTLTTIDAKPEHLQ